MTNPVPYQPFDGNSGLLLEDGKLTIMLRGAVVDSAEIGTSRSLEHLIENNIIARLFPDIQFSRTRPRNVLVEISFDDEVDENSEEAHGSVTIKNWNSDDIQVPWAAHLEANAKFLNRPQDDGRFRSDGRGWILNLGDVCHDAYMDWRIKDIVELVLSDLSTRRERPLPARFEISNVFTSVDLPDSCSLPLTVEDLAAASS